jgi:broad specificity phosphatase PhoE
LDFLRRGATCSSSSSSNSDEECHDNNIFPEDTIIVVHPELTGIPLYDWEGQNIRDLQEQDPDVYRAWIEGDAQKFRIAGHSPVSEVWERAAQLWPTVLRCPTEDAKNDDDSLAKTTLIVCHGTLSQALLATAFGWDESVFRKYDFPNAGLVELIWRVQDSHAYCWRWLYPQFTEWIYPESVAPARVVKKDGLD